jgi:hypothetical protein
LRALCAQDDGGLGLSLGIIWYRTRPTSREKSKDDGKHRSYLDHAGEYRVCDPELFDNMKRFAVPNRRNVEEVLNSGMLPKETTCYDPALSFSGMSRDQEERIEHRRKWFGGALESVNGKDLVFLDPDNGLEISTVRPYSDNGPKYVSLEELAILMSLKGVSIILYQHGWREKDFASLAVQRIGRLCSHTRPFGLLYSRGTQRLFIVIPSNHHERILRERAGRLIRSNWSNHFESQCLTV